LLEVVYDPEIKHARVGDLMTKDVMTVEDTALLAVAVNLLVVHRIRRLPVLRNGSLVGVISRGDLLRYFVKTGERLEAFFSRLRTSCPSWFEGSERLQPQIADAV